ncbi:hypothetical protein LR48_Vigan01g079800 [Vigna angularis]|uniref:Uncharacterized protein n=1 Tax=Phaseolus angularis TaxID=3914 RepID=A0A0L9TKX8_PHAAN|nr:hypothetical protein LR48_Vigan01g079800 [Vigna angularis]
MQARSSQLLADVKRIMRDTQRANLELKGQNKELAKTNEDLKKRDKEHTTTIVNLRDQLKEMMAYSRNLSTTCGNILLEKDALGAKIQAQDLQIAEMKKDIYEEHSLGFEKALRQIPHLLNVSIDGAGFDVMKEGYVPRRIGEYQEGDFLEPRLGRSDPLEEEGEEVGPGGWVVGENCGGEFGDGVVELLGDGFDGLLLERGEEDEVEGGASGRGEEWQEERVVVVREVAAEEDSGHGSGLRFGGGVEEVGEHFGKSFEEAFRIVRRAKILAFSLQ